MTDFIKQVGAIVIAGGILLIGWGTNIQDVAVGGNTPNQLVATSTTYTLTTTSQRLLSTSTSRVGAEFQSINCTTGGTVFLNTDGSDVAATTGNSDRVVFASSSKRYSIEESNPLDFGAVTGILDDGTCTVKVTEYRTR